MRKIILSMMVSADGYAEGHDPEKRWHNWNEEMSAYMMDFFRTVDTFIYGRKSYEQMIAYWPPLSDEFATIMNQTPKIVFSKTLEKASWNATIKKEVDVDEIKRLKTTPGRNMVIFAGPTVAASFIKHGLIDEYRLIVNPVLLGGGKAYFPSVRETADLKLISTRTFECGNALLVYEPFEE